MYVLLCAFKPNKIWIFKTLSQFFISTIINNKNMWRPNLITIENCWTSKQCGTIQHQHIFCFVSWNDSYNIILHGLVTQFLTTRKKNFKNGHDLLSPTGKLVLFWQMTIFVILIKVEFLSPQVRPVTRIGRWAPYRLFIPASISGTQSLNRSHKILRF